MKPDDRLERREVVRRQVRHQRIIALAIGAGCVSFLLFYFLIVPALRGDSNRPPGSADGGATSSPAAAPAGSPPPSASPPAVAASPTPSPVATVTVEPVAHAPSKPDIVQEPISFGPDRRQQMAAYSQRHYGDSSTHLAPKVIVVHYTAGSTWQSAWNLFDANQPNKGEMPGTVTHFIVDKDGTIYQVIPLDQRGRHTIGLNHVALGIEFVEEGSGGSASAVSSIFHRPQQIDAGLKLVRWLQYRFDIPLVDVIGHGTANESSYFKDNEGWTNDHADWGAFEVRLLHERLKALAQQ